MDNAVKKVIDESISDISGHQATQNAFRSMYLCSAGSVSDAEAASLLLETMGSEEAVKAWCQSHIALTKNVLRRWCMAAHIEAHERKGIKQ